MADKLRALIQLSTSGISSAYPITVAEGVENAYHGSGLTTVIEDIYGQLGTGGTVEQKIQEAINNLDSTKSGASTNDLVTVTVVETDGKLESVTVTDKISDTIDSKINELDSEKTSTDGNNVQVKVTEVDGKITAVNITTDNTVTSGDIKTAIDALDATVGEATVASGKHVAVQVTETDGKLTALTVKEDDIASAALLGATTDASTQETAFGYIAKEKARAEAAETALGNRLTTAEGDIDALEGRMATAEADIDALEGRMNTAEGGLTALSGRMDTAEDGLEALSGRMDDAEAAIETLEADLAAETTERENADNALDARIDALEAISGLTESAVQMVNGKTGSAVTIDGRDIKLDGYAKPETTTAITTGDTVNKALGKLEKGLEDAVAGGLQKVEAGVGIEVSAVADNKQTVSAKVNTAATEGVSLSVDADGIKVNVASGSVASGNGNLVNGGQVYTAIEEKVATLDYTDTADATKYVSKVSETDGVISVERTSLVKEGEKVLSVDGGSLKTTLGLGTLKESGTTYIILSGASEEVARLDAGEFVKEGMLYGEEVFTATGATHTTTIGGQSVTFSGLTSGTTYLGLVFVNTDAAGETTYTTQALDVSKLVDVYTGSNGVKLVDGKDFQGVVDSDSETFLTVGANGFKLSGVQSAITTAIEALDATAGTQTVADGKHVAVEVVETDGKVTAVTVTESDIASATALTQEIADRAQGDEDTLASAKTYTDTVVSGLDATVSATSTTIGAISITVAEEDGKLTSVSMTEQVAGKDGDGNYQGGVMSAAQAEKLDDSITYHFVREVADWETTNE